MKKKLKFLNFEKVFNKKTIGFMVTAQFGLFPIAGGTAYAWGYGGGNGGSQGGGGGGGGTTPTPSPGPTPAPTPAAPAGTPDAGSTGGCGASNPGNTDPGIPNLPLPTLPNLPLPPVFCWVAREIYGENNIKWQLFRFWMLNQSPKWFLKLYTKHGESTAKFLKNKTTLKSIIRIWMDYIISNKLKAEYNFAI